MAQALRKPVPLPSTTVDLLDHRKLKTKRTINDMVEDYVVKLWENEEFQRNISAVYDSESAEGDTFIDDVYAATIIRNAAKKDNQEELASKPLDAIIRAMKVSLRRYGMTRKERVDNGQPIANDQ